MNPFLTDYLSLYDLFVNKVFGNLLLATIGLFGLFLLLGILMKMSMTTALTIAGLFAVSFTSTAGNPWISFIAILIAGIYFVYNLFAYVKGVT